MRLPIPPHSHDVWLSEKRLPCGRLSPTVGHNDENPNHQTVLGRISGILVAFRALPYGCPRNFALHLDQP